MKKENLLELDILRIISCLIVVILIHIPNDYAYNFYKGQNTYTEYLFNNLGVLVAMGSFVFISGFTLYLRKSNRNLNSKKKIKIFLKKRFLRIFPLYWIALIIYFILFYSSYMSLFYRFAHVFGLQMIFVPIGGDPIWTIWFIGIIVIYYMVFILLSYLDSLKKIIPAAILIQAGFVTFDLLFNTVEYRFFLYYNIFILGIIMAKLYTSQRFTKVKESLMQKNKHLSLSFVCLMAVINIPIYLFLTQYCYNFFHSRYGTHFLFIIIVMHPGIFEIATAFLLMQLLIVFYLIGSLSLLYLVKKFLCKIFIEEKIHKIFSAIAYSTFCVYLFHRPIIILFSAIITGIFNVDMYAKANIYIALLFIPIIFLFSYCLQKTVDWSIACFIKRKQKK